MPTAWDTSATSAPVASHIADTAFIEEILWARNALATWWGVNGRGLNKGLMGVREWFWEGVSRVIVWDTSATSDHVASQIVDTAG